MHPDLFAKAPQKVRDTNSESTQALNAYLQATQTLNSPVPELELVFFVSKDKLLEDNKKD